MREIPYAIQQYDIFIHCTWRIPVADNGQTMHDLCPHKTESWLDFNRPALSTSSSVASSCYVLGGGGCIGGVLGLNASATVRSYRGGDDDVDQLLVSLLKETGTPRGNHRATCKQTT